MRSVAQQSLFTGGDAPRHFAGGTIPRTELPWYAINDSDPSDQFYTKRDVAKRCFGVFRNVAKAHGYNLRNHTYLEPSAGEGCFTDLLPKRKIALDIEPRAKGIKKQDFLVWSPKPGKYAVIGNPPFGQRGALALAFMNRSALFADIVGFILPMTFASNGKGGALTRVKGLHLLHSEELDGTVFYDAENNDRAVNTVFQVWGSRNAPKSPVFPTCNEFVEILTVCTNPDRRCGFRRMDEYDYFVQGTFYDNAPPKVVTDFADVKYGSGYGVIIKKKRRDIKRALRNADWAEHSSRSTNHCRHIRMQHIRDVITAAGFKDAT